MRNEPDARVAQKRTTPIRYVPKLRRSGRPTAPAPIAPAMSAPPLATRKIPSLESKIVAAGHDSEQILRTLDTELALARAGRQVNGQDNVQAIRVLSVAMLFTLLLAALGAMSYLQTQFVSHGFKRRPGVATAADASANPAPGPSAPDAAPDRQSVPPTR